MPHLTKLLGATALVCAALPASAEVWRLSSMMTPDSFEGQAYQRFADLVEEYTDGDITVRIYPNEQIGSMDSVVARPCRRGCLWKLCSSIPECSPSRGPAETARG